MLWTECSGPSTTITPEFLRAFLSSPRTTGGACVKVLTALQEGGWAVGWLQVGWLGSWLVGWLVVGFLGLVFDFVCCVCG